MSNPAEHQALDQRATMLGSADPLIGMVIDGRYRIEKVLGEGGMGLVYRATHVVLNKPLAVKVLRAEVSNNEEVIARFRQEAQSATAIGNQHIIDVLDFGTLPDGATYFVMEFLNGRALTDVIETDAPLAVPRVVHVAKQLCDALGSAHGAGIVHRDLKPDNVFLVKRGNETDFVKVLDFGIAKVGGSSSKLTRAGQVFGTPHYMSPEQCQGQAVDLRADVYALGVILFELVTGRVPFDADNFVGLLTQHILQPPPAPSSFRPDCPPELEAIILRCLEKDPAARYVDCAAMSADLDLFAAGLPVSLPRVSGIVEARGSAASMHPPAVSVPPASSAPPGLTHAEAQARSRIVPIIGLVVGTLGLGALALAGYKLTRPKPAAPAIAIPTIPATPAVGAGQEPAAPATSPHILLITEPSGAEVTSDGELLGITPLQIDRPASGQRRVLSFQLAGFDSREVTISSSTVGSELRFTLGHSGATRANPRANPRTSTTPSDSAMAAPTSAAPPPATDSTQAEPPRRRHTSEVLNPWAN